MMREMLIVIIVIIMLTHRVDMSHISKANVMIVPIMTGSMGMTMNPQARTIMAIYPSKIVCIEFKPKFKREVKYFF